MVVSSGLRECRRYRGGDAFVAQQRPQDIDPARARAMTAWVWVRPWLRIEIGEASIESQGVGRELDDDRGRDVLVGQRD